MDDNLTQTRTHLDALLWRQVETEPLAALRVIADLQQDLAIHERAAVRAAIRTSSWAEVGRALGVSKQGVHQRYAKLWGQTLTEELKVENRAYKAARATGAKETAAAAKARRDAVVAEFKATKGRRS